MGFRACRVEASGALTMAMSNGMSLQEKRASINGFRESVQVYGLDLKRMSMMADPGALWDDGCLLVCAADDRGNRPRLFNQNGSPSSEVLSEGCRSRKAVDRCS